MNWCISDTITIGDFVSPGVSVRGCEAEAFQMFMNVDNCSRSHNIGEAGKHVNVSITKLPREIKKLAWDVKKLAFTHQSYQLICENFEPTNLDTN